MDERRKVLLTIIVCAAGLFFLSTRFYLPISKDNAKRRTEYRKLRQEVEAISEFGEQELSSLQSRIEAAISDLENRLPAQGKLKLMEQLTRVPADANIVFTEITHKSPQGREGYQAFPVEVNIKASFYDLIKYLAEIETASLMIGVDRLSLRRAEAEAKSLDVKATFAGFRLERDFPPVSKYLKEGYKPPDKQRLETLLKPLKLPESASAVSVLKDYNPFISGYDVEKPPLHPIIEPIAPVIEIENLSLKGILRFGDRKAALINDSVVREGETIGGVTLLEIQDYQVVVILSGKRYILKMGVDDEFIKP